MFLSSVFMYDRDTDSFDDVNVFHVQLFLLVLVDISGTS